MKKFVSISLFILMGITAIVLNSCTPKDTTAPTIYLVGSNDTTVLLWTQYTDPGVIVEDNKDIAENITVTDDIEDELTITDQGYLRLTGDYEVTYTAKDQAGNETTKKKTIYVKNITEPMYGTYDVDRLNSNFHGDTNYVASILADVRKAGRIRITRVYLHYDDENGDYASFVLKADLRAPNGSMEDNSMHGYLGDPANPGTPFFEGMNYEEATDSIRGFTYLDIPRYITTDSTNNVEYTVEGVEDDATGLPESRITYTGDQVTEIILKYNVTKEGEVQADVVNERYVPR